MNGLSKERIKMIINSSLNKNPDIKYYINNEYVEELVELLIDGVATAICENNRDILESF